MRIAPLWQLLRARSAAPAARRVSARRYWTKTAPVAATEPFTMTSKV